MADSTTEIATLAADAPAATPTPAKPMTQAEARAILDGAALPAEPDPLFVEGAPDPLFSDGGPDPLGTAEPTPEPEPEPAPVEPEVPAAETPEPEVQPSPTNEPAIAADADGRKRINILRKNADGTFFFSARDRAIMNESAEAGISLAEAEKRLFGGSAAAPTEAEPITPAAEKAKTSTGIKAEISTLRAQRREAMDSYDRKKEGDLTEQIEDLQAEHSAALLRETQAERDAKQQAQSSEQSFTTAKEASEQEAGADYPDVWTDGTPLNQAARAEHARWVASNSPYLSDPEWPYTLAAKVAARMGIAPAKAAAAAPAKPAPPRVLPAPVRRATPVPSPGTVSGATPAPDPFAELGQQLQEARKRGDLRGIRVLQEKINSLPDRSRAA